MKRRIALDVALAVAVAADVLTFSRAGLLGLAIVGTILAIAGVRCGAARTAAGPGRARRRRCRRGLVDLLRAHRQRAAPFASGKRVCRRHGESRELWGAAWRMWLDRPVLGVGAGNYELELPEYGVFGVRTHANSWFLQSLAEGGALLFAATLALIAAIVWTFARELRRRASPWVLAAFAASCALVLHQIADYLVFYPKVGGSWWLLIGLGAAAVAARASET